MCLSLYLTMNTPTVTSGHYHIPNYLTLYHLTQNQPENDNMQNFTIDDVIIELLTRGHVSELEAQQMIADAAGQDPLPELN